MTIERVFVAGAGLMGHGIAQVHASIGKASFDSQKLLENITAFIGSIMRAKPQTSKGKYVRGITLSSTMGPGVPVTEATMTATEKQ